MHELEKFDLTIVDYLGSGTFGSVYKCYDRESKKNVAVKYFNLRKNSRKDYEREVSFSKFLI